jgi:MFS transporter, Spinster family, sphingosine-1-phosphate transporter
MPIHPWLLVWLLWVVALLNYLDRQVIYSLFPLLGRELGAGSVELGLITTVFLWVYGLLSPFAGYLADRFGRVRVILSSLLVWSAVTWWTSHVGSMEELLWTRALMGISEAFYLPAALALIVETHPERSRSLATGLHQSGLYTGMIVGGAWGGWMGENYGWRPVFTILGATGVGWFIILSFFLRRVPERNLEPVAKLPFGTSLRTLLRLRGFGVLALVFATISMANWLIYTWLPLYLYEHFGMSMTEAGFTATFYIQIASYAGIICGGWLADRWSSRTSRGRVLTQVAGLGIAAPFLGLLAFASSWPVLLIAMIVFGLGRGFYDSNTMPVLSQMAGPNLRATGYGIFNLAGCLVGGFTAAFAGYFKENIGIAPAFGAAAILLAGAAFLLLRGVKPQHDQVVLPPVGAGRL